MTPEYNAFQQTFALNWLSNVLANVRATTSEELTERATKDIDAILGDARVQKLIGQWKVVWGPVAWSHKGTDKGGKRVADNTMFVARQGDGNVNPGVDNYVVAIAGTNPLSWYGWLVEDFNVKDTVAWEYLPQGYQGGLSPRVSAGTNIGVDVLMAKMTDPAKGGTLVEFLKAEMAKATCQTQISVSGHSLGGALSAAVALALENLRQDEDKNWDPKNLATVCALPTAGATPGDRDFALYYDQVMGARTNRIWNKFDVVPHAWQLDMLQAASGLYYPFVVPNLLVDALVALAMEQSAGNGYLQIMAQTPAMESSVNLPLTSVHALMSGMEKSALTRLLTVLFERVARNKNHVLPEALAKGLADIIEAILARDEPWLVKLLEHIVAGLSDDLKTFIRSLMHEVAGLLLFLAQAGYQHVAAYTQLLGISELARIMEQIRSDSE